MRMGRDRCGAYIICGCCSFFILYYALDVGNVGTGAAQWISSLPDVLSINLTHPIFLLAFIGLFFSSARYRVVAVFASSCIAVGVPLFVLSIAFTERSDCAFLAVIIAMAIAQLLLGVGLAWCLAVWVGRLSRMTMDKSLVILISSVCVASLVRLILNLIDSSVAFYLVVSVCTLITVALVLRDTSRSRDHRDLLPGSSRSLVLSSAEIRDFFTMLKDDYLQPIAFAGVVFVTCAFVRPLFSVSEPATVIALWIHSAGMLAGNIVLLILWRRIRILFDTALGAPIFFTVLVVMLVLWVIPHPITEMLGLFLASSCHSSALAILICICLEITREKSQYALASSALTLFFMGMLIGVSSCIGEAVRVVYQSEASMLLAFSSMVLLSLTSALLWTRTYRDANVRESFEEPFPRPLLHSFSEADVRGSQVLKDRYGISSRECDVLLMVLSAYSTSGIAKALFISENTVKAHKKSLYKKLDVHSSQELIDVVIDILGATEVYSRGA